MSDAASPFSFLGRLLCRINASLAAQFFPLLSSKGSRSTRWDELLYRMVGFSLQRCRSWKKTQKVWLNQNSKKTPEWYIVSIPTSLYELICMEDVSDCVENIPFVTIDGRLAFTTQSVQHRRHTPKQSSNWAFENTSCNRSLPRDSPNWYIPQTPYASPQTS